MVRASLASGLNAWLAFFLLFGLCVSADTAADLAALLEFLLRKTSEATDAAFLLVTSFFAILLYLHCIT